VAVDGRNLEILMAAPYLFEAMPVMESSNNLTFTRARHNSRSSARCAFPTNQFLVHGTITASEVYLGAPV
jgi:hypothetical protein